MADVDDKLLIDIATLRRWLPRADVRILDCRFDLAAPRAARAAYLEGHVPGAIHVDLERDLSARPGGDRGRHPMPSVAQQGTLFSRLGIDADTRVVVYDDTRGMIAARAWWMLRYLGHSQVAMLDGGWPCWVAAGAPVRGGQERVAARSFRPRVAHDRLLRLADVGPGLALIDARDPARFRGEFEPLDPRAGHIPGARNHPWHHNLAADGRFLAPQALRSALTDAAGAQPDAATVHYCGSGVSACVNVFAQAVAGLPLPRLYCGSFSEWCRDANRRVMIGEQPD